MARPKGSKNKPKKLADNAPLHLWPAPAREALAVAQGLGFVAEAEPEGEPERVPGLRADMPFREFLEVAKIREKGTSRLITPVLNDEQEEIDAAWEAGDEGAIRNVLALKPRKIGLTTYFALRFHHRFATATDPVQLWHLANRADTAEEIMRMHKIIHDNLPDDLRCFLPVNQAKRMERRNRATIAVETARAGIRGFSPDWLHIAEFAFCFDPEEVRSAAIGSVATEAGGRIALESTANHVGDVMHEEMKASQRGDSELAWKTFFFPWFRHQEYRLPAPGLVMTPEEEKLAELHDLEPEQLAWRRSKIAQMGAKKFRREFPATIEDAYSSQKGQWLTADQLDMLGVVQVAPQGVTYLEPYDPADRYAFGMDCAAGVGLDFTDMHGINVRTRRLAAVYRSNQDDTERGVDAAWQILQVYGDALVLVERNRWGIPYLNGLRALRANMYQEQRHETDGQIPTGAPADFVTNERTRNEVLEAFKSSILRGETTIVDSVCFEELRAAYVDQDGRIVIPRTKDGHGDALVAHALALRCAGHVPIPQVQPSSLQRELLRRKMLALGRATTDNTGGRY